MKNFKYIGSQAHNSTILVDEEGKKTQKDLRLAPGDEKELPEDHPVVKALINRGLLVETKLSTASKKV